MIFLPHGIVIQNKSDAYNYLYSLGFSKLEIQEFVEYLEIDPDAREYLEQEAQEWEDNSAEEFEKRNGLINDMLEVAECLIKGKGTKAELAKRIKEQCDYWY